MGWRIGQFFLVIGLVTLVVFAGTASERQPAWEYGLVGLVSSVLGGYLMWRNRIIVRETERFRTIRKLSKKRTKSSEKFDEKEVFKRNNKEGE